MEIRCVSANSANVIDSVENDKNISWFMDTQSIVLGIQRQPGTNTIEVVDGIRKLLPQFRSQIPPSVKLTILHDRSVSIRESIADVKFTLLLTICLVVMVIFLFLRNVSATAIPSFAVPLAIVGNVRGHVPARLHGRQSVLDGAHALGRFRGGRRHRDAREYRPPHGTGRKPHGGGTARARARSASPSSP